MNHNAITRRVSAGVGALALASSASAQSSQPAIFVSNDGNIEGSVTSYLLNPDGSPVFNDLVLTSDTSDDPGNNAYTIDVTPNGKYLAVGHAAGGTSAFRQLTFLEVAPDATMSIVAFFNTPRTPLDLLWIDDEYLAVLRSDSSGGPNEVIVYRFDPEPTPSLTEVDSAVTGGFSTSIVRRPGSRVLYTNISLGTDTVITYEVDATGQIEEIDRDFTGSTFPLGLCASASGEALYSFGGISSGGNAILGFGLNTDGTPTPLPGSPFTSPGASPKGGATSEDGSILFVAHGTDATVRSFLIDGETGELTSTGSSYDVGLQGSLAEVAVLGGIVYATDNTNAIDMESGLIALTFDAQGTLTKLGPTVPSQGVSPTGIAVWPGPQIPCPTDVNGSGATDLQDVLDALANFGTASGATNADGDVDGDGDVDLQDVLDILAAFGQACP